MLLKFRLDENGFVFSNPADLIAARSIDYIKCHFDIVDPIWKNTHAIVAVFKSATYNKYADVLLDSNNNCYIDPEVYKCGGVIQVKLIGDRYLNEEVISSTSITAVLEFKINENIIIPTETPSKYDVFVAELEQAKASVDSALTDLATKLARGDFDGVGIDSVAYNVDGTLTITLTDGSEFISEYSMKGARGDDGTDGVGIADIVQNLDGTLSVVLTDGSRYSTQPLKGEKGDAFTFDDFTPEELEAITGERGTGILAVTTTPTTIAGSTLGYKYSWDLDTVTEESDVDYVLVGDVIEHSYYHYPVIAISGQEGEAGTVYTGERVSIRGATGATGTRGGRFLRISTVPTAYQHVVKSKQVYYRILASTVYAQSDFTPIVGDILSVSNALFPVLVLSDGYAYTDAAISTKGNKGDKGDDGDKGDTGDTGDVGYMFFDIDANGDLIYQRVSGTPIDFNIVNGDLYMEATI